MNPTYPNNIDEIPELFFNQIKESSLSNNKNSNLQIQVSMDLSQGTQQVSDNKS